MKRILLISIAIFNLLKTGSAQNFRAKQIDVLNLTPFENVFVRNEKQPGASKLSDHYRNADLKAGNNNSKLLFSFAGYGPIINFTKNRFEIGFSMENMLNTIWDAKFAPEVGEEIQAIADLNFIPGDPVVAKLKVAVFF